MPGVYIQEKPKATASMLKLGVSVQAVASEPARSIVQKLAAIETTNTGSRLRLRSVGHEKKLALKNSEDLSLSLESIGKEAPDKVYLQLYNEKPADAQQGAQANAWQIGMDEDLDLHVRWGPKASPDEGRNGNSVIEEPLTIKNNGLVGIGTTDPQSKLSVSGGVGIGSSYAGTNAAPTDGLIVEGNVGIGTTNPGSFKLAVNGNLSANKYVVQDSVDGGSSKGIFMWKANDSNWGIYMGQSGANKSLAGGSAVAGAGFTTHAIRLRTTSSTTQGLIVENSSEQLNLSVRGSDGLTYIRGNVGIGTTTPSVKLEVQGGQTVLEQEAWHTPTFQNGWVNFGGPYNSAGYFKDSLGIVHLRGLVKSGSDTIFTLPTGYRPPKRELQAVQTNPNTIGRIDILADGQVLMYAGSNSWISLDGITFRAA